jgi:hypothetical protein
MALRPNADHGFLTDPLEAVEPWKKEINIQSLITTLLVRSVLETGHRFATNYNSLYSSFPIGQPSKYRTNSFYVP